MESSPHAVMRGVVAPPPAESRPVDTRGRRRRISMGSFQTSDLTRPDCMIQRTLSFLLLAGLALGLAGCEDPTGPPQVALLLQVRAMRAPTVPPSGSATPSPARAPGIETIDITEAVLVFGGLGLEGAGIDGTVDWRLEETVVVPLRLSGDPTLALSTPVPQGEYAVLEVFLDHLDPGVAADEEVIDVFPRLEGAGVLVSGTLTRDGVEEIFTFTAPIAVREEFMFPAPRRFSQTFRSAALYTLNVDMDQWFAAEFGELFDPTDPADQAAIRTAIEGSMELIQGGQPGR